MGLQRGSQQREGPFCGGFMGIFYGSRKVTLRLNSGGEELARAVLGVPSVDCSSISIIALGQKAEEKEISERFL